MTKEDFCKDISNFDNHRLLLWYALKETKGDVIEMGCGDGSTRQLYQYCKDSNRKLYSFDTSQEWMDKFSDCKSEFHQLIPITNNWDIVKYICPNPSVVLIDHAPGERRITDVEIFSNINGILVLHDTQPPPTAANYGWEKIWHLFKYRCDIKTNDAWATAVSNVFNVRNFVGESYSKFEIS